MLTLFFIAIVFALLVLAFRWQRKREIDAFMASDLSAIEAQLLGGSVGLERAPVPADALPERAGAGAERPQAAPVPIPYLPRERIFDDVTRSFLTALDGVIGNRYRVFVNVPVSTLIRHPGEGGAAGPLPRIPVSFVICARAEFALRCAVQLVDGSESSRRQIAELRTLCAQIGAPLLEFPIATNYSAVEIRERLAAVLR